LGEVVSAVQRAGGGADFSLRGRFFSRKDAKTQSGPIDVQIAPC